MINVYLAGPFFNPEQVAVIEKLERLLAKFPVFSVYSPRVDGVLIEMSAADKIKNSRQVFMTNCQKLRWADLVLAVVDGRDTGTTWEMGFAFATGIKIITYTDNDYGLNVMIQESVAAHARGEEDAEKILSAINRFDVDRLKDFRNFHPAVT